MPRVTSHLLVIRLPEGIGEAWMARDDPRLLQNLRSWGTSRIHTLF